MALDVQVRLVRVFRSVQADPACWPDPVHLQEMADWMQGFRDSSLGADLADRLRQGIVDGLVWLDALPRNDPLWRGTNRRPTLSKINEAAEKVLVGLLPARPWAAWVQAGRELRYGYVSFGLLAWRWLSARGSLDAAWPVCAAWYVYNQTGFDTSLLLIDFLRERDLGFELRSALEGLPPRDRGTPWPKRVRDGVPLHLSIPEALLTAPPVRGLLEAILRDHALNQLPILADALEDAGCSDERVLAHLRSSHEGRTGCWLIRPLLKGGTGAEDGR